METWVAFALVYPIMFAFANLIDKFLVDKRVKNCFSLCIIFSFTAFLAGLIAMWFFPFYGMTLNVIFLGLLSGVLLSFALFSYFYTLSFEDVSRIVSIAYVTPVFVLIFAVVFLGEHLPTYKIWAILAAATGAILMGVEWSNFRFRRGFWFILLSCALWA